MSRTQGAVGLKRRPLELLLNRRGQLIENLNTINGEIAVRLGFSTPMLTTPGAGVKGTPKKKKHTFPRLTAEGKQRQLEGIKAYHERRRAAKLAASQEITNNQVESVNTEQVMGEGEGGA